MPPMHEPKLIELGKLRFGAAGVAASIVILLPLKTEIRPMLPNQIVMNLVERFPVMTKRSKKAEEKHTYEKERT